MTMMMMPAPTPDATTSSYSTKETASCPSTSSLLDVFAEQYLTELADDMNVEKSMDDPLPVEFSDLLLIL